MRLHRLTAVLAASVLIWTGVPTAHAIDVTPMVVHITPTGTGAGYRLSVKNTDDQPVTIELQAFRMEVDENGARSLTEEESDAADEVKS